MSSIDWVAVQIVFGLILQIKRCLYEKVLTITVAIVIVVTKVKEKVRNKLVIAVIGWFIAPTENNNIKEMSKSTYQINTINSIID